MLTQVELDGLVKEAWENMESKGLHDGMPDTAESVLFRISLTFTEVSEAMQEAKRHWGKPTQTGHEEKLCEELADTVLRLLDMAGCHNLPLSVEGWQVPHRIDRTAVIVYLGRMVVRLGKAFTCADVFDIDSPLSQDRAERVASHSSQAIAMCESLAKALDRDLWAAVRAKNAVNATRPYKYGTPEAAS